MQPLNHSGPSATPARTGSAGRDHALVRLPQNRADRPPVFALPGVLGMGESFAQLSAHFQDRGFSAVSTADLVQSLAGRPDAADLAASCAQVIAGASSGPVHLVGHSYGGCLALYVAEQLRDRGVPVWLCSTLSTQPP